MDKKALAVALALTTIGSAAYCSVASAPPWATISIEDTDLFWREASGPNGEQDAAALPLFRAVFAHDKEAVTTLLENGVSPNAVLYPKAWSPLMVAVAYHDVEMVDLLLKRDANINYVSKDPADYTALGVAISATLDEGIRSGKDEPLLDYSMFNHLLDAGADVNLDFGYDNDIAKWAATLGQMELVNRVLARGYDRDLTGLNEILHVRRVDKKTEPEKQKAIKTIESLLRNR